jgi:hypothetical protein
MEPTSARVRQLLNTLGPVVIRDSDRHMPATGIGGGVAIIDYGPPKPLPADFLEKFRELANNTPPTASPGP